MEFNDKLNKYVDLILRVGLNIKHGDFIQLKCNTDHIHIARLLVRRAYELGAAYVMLDLQDDEIDSARYDSLHSSFIDTFPDILADQKLALYKEKFLQITLIAPHSTIGRDLDSVRMHRINKAKSLAMRDVMTYGMENHCKWVVAAVATSKWAKLVFPDEENDHAIHQLWEQIFKATRVLERNPVLKWEEHIKLLETYQMILNERQFKELHFLGEETDLYVGLVEGHNWIGGLEKTTSGESFISNLPVEEVWTMPHAHRVSGHVKLTKPFWIEGHLVSNLKIHFKDGDVTKVVCDEEEIVNQLLRTDIGASRLGEVALVSIDSPIEQTGLYFHETLFDENAASHLAFGQAYSDNLVGCDQLSKEERVQRGMNESAIHVDFMIGSKDMNVFGVTYDGQRELIMEHGKWALSN
ncbi:aminopeptidase [Alkalicoccobacillus gibsonii]|uniref:aminopeptidase n=1 Tax=Alkalicoccobacillus gibsonii TaxID=79881 RepID=UPI0019313316|nr:aminopeptidase [Alkalicoccobacillus gibsonii]MBM0066322.1 aminopeptidase [Alkalicoccobacillus gibsonii]